MDYDTIFGQERIMSINLSEHFTIRPAVMDDLEAAVALFNACSIEQVGKAEHDVEETRTDWGFHTFNLETDTQVVIAPDGKLVGYIGIWDSEPHVRLYGFGRVRPESRGQGIGTVLCQWAEARARQAIPKAPEGSRVVALQSALSTDAAAQELLAKQNYQLVRHSFRMVIEMETPPPEPAAPPGITIRPYHPGRGKRVLVLAVRDAFKDHWGFVEQPFEEEYREWMHWIATSPRYDPSLWFVAMDDGEIAGLSLCDPDTVEDPEMGYVGSLGVRRPWRRRGLGLALLRHSFGEFYRRGTCKVCLGVDAQSLTGATRLYEKAGMRVQRQYDDYEKELCPGVDLSTQSVQE